MPFLSVELSRLTSFLKNNQSSLVNKTEDELLKNFVLECLFHGLEERESLDFWNVHERK
ncbi:hypothetical protein Bca101_013250 [Brassica carinata]